MQSHAPASTRKSAGYFHRNGLLSQLVSVLLAWTMVMSSLPAYATDQPHAEWVHSLNLDAITKPATEPAQHGPTSPMAARPTIAKTIASPRLATNPTIAALHAPALPGNQGSDLFLNAFSNGLFPLLLQAPDSQLQVSVGFADNSSSSANFPEPWNEANPLINFAGGGTVYRAGAIRLDNPGNLPVNVDSVKVDLGRPGPVFQLWQNVVIPAGGSTILTQTQDGNFNTSASPIVGCGLALAANETRIPKITVTVAGTSTDYADTAHVLDTGGFDSSCRGNQSLEWRPVGTTGVESPGGSIELVSDGAPHAVGTQDTLTIQINDAGNQPLANSPVKLNVMNGPNVGKAFTGITDNTGVAVIQYSSSAQGNDLIQAVMNNLSGGSLLSQQATATWSSADACAAPVSPSAAAARLIYIGQNSVSFGNTMRLAVLLTDGTGNPLSGRNVSFTFAGNTSLATTDGNGTAMVLASTLPVGQSTINISFAGDAAYQSVQLSAAVTVLPAPTLLRYTGANLVTALGTQQVSAVLTNSLGTTPVAGRTVTFTMNGISASGVTDINGNATATLNFATAQPTGAAQLQISFAGDANYRPSSRTAPVRIYQPMPFVIWGGNTGGLRIGQRVNFWGSQWESQVINGQYFAANPSFKGWSGALTGPIQPCQADVTQANLTSACWDVKPGQSFPPDQVLPSLIEVIVSTVVDKSGSDVFGNIACGAVLQVDHTPPYGAVPGQDGFGTIVAVSGGCSGVFPAPAVLVGSQQQTSLVLPNQGVPINYSIRNSGATDATSVTLNESFDQVTPASATANIGTIGAGLTNTGGFQVTIPAIEARQSAESSVDYQSRLAAQDGRLFTSQAEATFTDVFAQIYAPVDFSSFSTLTLPRLSVGISGVSCVAPGSSIPYSLVVANDGSATGSHIAATLALPDGTTATPVVPDLTAGTRFAGTVNWSSPGIAAKLPTESTQDYLARLQAADGITLPAAVFSSTWQDSLGNSYGPVEQPFIALTQRIPVISSTVPATQGLLPNQATQFGFNVSNTGTGNAVQVTLRIKRQDGTFINVPTFSLPGGESASLNASYSAPAIAAKGASETDAAYTSRLQSMDNTTLNLDAVLQWTDPANNNYGSTDNPFTATEQLPILSVSLDAPAKANSGDTISYVVTLTNTGHATANTGAISIVLPDGSIAHPAPLANSIAPGASTTATVSYTIPANHPSGIISATASAGWSDSAANSYGPLSASTSTDVTLPNLPPVVSAGADQTVPFPNNFPLQGTVTDDGKPVGGQLTSTWTQISGPSNAIFADPHSPQTTVQLNAEGTYVLKLTGDDSQLQSSAQVSITTTHGNTGPVVTVGPDQTIQLPINTASLTGSATDDGLPVGSSITYLWKEVTGPGTVTFAAPTAPNTTATFPAMGVYLLRLSASDSQLTGSADLRITVLPHNNPPTVNAGPAQTIFQPVNTANVQGVISDDGLPAGGTLTSTWSVVSGPGIVTFANPGSPTTAATFSTIGVYTLRLTASDSQLTASADTTVTVKPANLSPVVNAGPTQTVVLPSNVSTLPPTPTLVPISTGFNNPVGIDYHQPTNKVVMSVNYINGLPHNFELVAPDGSRSQFSNIKGLTDEVYIAAARDEVNGHSIGGFTAGEMFTGSGVAGVVVRISPDGNTVQNPWITLPGETGLLRGQLYIDRTGVFGGDLIIATTAGNIWRVNSSGVAKKLANVGVPPEGLITIPNDPLHYGPWAGKILTGSENSGRLFAIDPDNVVTFFDFGIAAENIKLVNANENFFGVDYGNARLVGIPAAELAGMVGDILIGEETGTLTVFHWNGTHFEGTRFAQVSQWEGTTMAPAGIIQVASTTASVTLNGTVSDDGLPAGGTLTSLWSKVSGPGTVTFINTLTPVTTASFSQPGTYVLRLTATDTELTSSSDVTIVISANQAPVLQVGSSQEITLPATANLTGTVTDDGLPAGGKLSSFWTKAIGPGSVTFSTPSFDGTDNFSATSNPSGPWSYGSTPTRGGVFTPYAFTGQLFGMPTWFKTSPAGGTTFPLLAYNNTGVSVNPSAAGLNIPPQTLLLHPGPSGENSVLRFTAPADGSYLVQGRFYGVDVTTTDVSILLNSSTTLMSGSVPNRNLGVPFTFVRALKAGDKVDFSVGFGNGNNNSDSTGLQVIVTQAGNTSSTASFSSPGDYILRLTGSDSELFTFSDTHVHVSTPCVPAPSGLVGWWPGDGDTRDLANANAGVVEDGLTFVPGVVGKAFGLNGGAADVVVPASTALNVKSFTMSAWVFPLDVGVNRPILEYSSSNGATTGVTLWENLDSSQIAPGSVHLNIIDTNGGFHIISTGAGALQYKRWNHVAVTYDQATGVARTFVNGSFIGSITFGAFTPRTNLPLYIGARPNGNHFLGNIDEPQVYNRALSPFEIQNLYTAGSAGNCKPTGTQPPVVSAGLDQTITLPTTQVILNGTATDPNGGQLSIAWSVDSAPGPVIFANPSSPTTTATFTAPGIYVLRLTASTSQLTATSVATVAVIAVANKAPQVSAGPNQTIQFPQSSVTLNGTVSDDGLPVGRTVTQQWSKFSGPAPVTFSAPTQAVTQATFTTPGTYTLQLTATDSEFTVSAQVTITVLAAPTPNQSPAISITADNVNLTLPANVVSLTGTITDDGQPAGSTVTAQWTQVSGPAPATFSSPNSASTQATFSVAGSYVLKLTASDSQLSNSVSVPITVNPPAPNQAPSVTVIASQNSITLPANTLSLTGKITDDGLPVGGKITFQWSALSGPAPVTFSNPTGGSTQAVFSVAGTYVLQLAASDSQLTGTGSVSITVNPAGTNQPPVVSIAADNTAITLPTNNVTLTGTVTDDGLPTGAISTQWFQVSGPVAATITQITQTSVKVTFTTAGVYTFKLTASDGQLSTSATINITVTTAGGNQPPAVTAGANQTITLPQNTASLRGDARDDGLPAGSTLSVTWSALSGPAPVVFSDPNSLVTQATFGAAGVYVLQLLASDTQLQSTAQVTISVLSSVAPPPPPPVVSFAGLTDGAEITKPTPIIGSVSTGTWKLEYSLLDGSGNPTTFTTLASGAAPVTNSTLGTFDPTVLLNGQYVVRFSSTDNAGQTSSTSSTVDVSRNAKVGNFTLSFNDLSVPLPGLPITITRTYDSRDKRVGDFGVGWTLSVANVRVQKTGGAIGTGWEEDQQWSGFFPTYCLLPVKNHTVSVTFPDGKVYKFTAVNTPECQQLVPIDVPQIGFTQLSTGSATAGATLTPLGDTDLLLDNGIPGPVNLINAEVEFADFSQFQLTTAEGYKYILDQKLGVTSVTDRNGNQLTINASGISSSSGTSVAFIRDAQQRITQITDPNGATLQYQYDGNGDLVQVIDRVNQSTTFAYGPNHFLTDVIDARGVQAVKNIFDDNGRLISSTDASGKTITYAPNLGANQELITDRLGNSTLYEYDADGNVVRTTDALGNVTLATYDANDNKLTGTNALGKVSSYTYNVLGNRLTETDPLGHVTTYTYNSRRQQITATDALGHTTTRAYDPDTGNLLSTTDASGAITKFSYSPAGQISSLTDAAGNKTSFIYDAAGRLTQQTDALNNVTSFTYDANGNKLTQSATRTKSDGTRETLTTHYEYDGNGQLTTTTYPDGSLSRTVYNVVGKQSDTFDALNHKTHYDYDDNGRLIKTTYPDSTTESSTYDSNDHVLTSTDRAGRTTTYTYDALGRLTNTVYPDQSSSQSVYDAIGQTIKVIDGLNHATVYAYDDAGRRISVTDSANNTTQFIYDAVGNQSSMTDALNHTTQYLYDGANRPLKTSYPDGTFASSAYDAVGRLSSRTDQAGKTTHYTYDALGRLKTVTDALNRTTQYGYDEVGNRIAQTDANTHITRFAYDQRGRRVLRTLPLGMSESYVYDADGNLTSKTDPNGHTTVFAYDAMNRLTSKTADAFFATAPCGPTVNCGATQVSYTYFSSGRRASMTDISGTTAYTYDARDRLLTKQTPNAGTLSYGYDAAGNMVSLKSSHVGGAGMVYSYDTVNRLSAVTDASGTINYAYDAAGNLSGYGYPNSVSTSYTYDTLNRLKTMQSVCGSGTGCRSPGASVSSYSYTLGAAGNRLSVQELSGRTVQYGYDDVYRLTSETVSADPSGKNGTVGYTYDAAGNHTQRSSTLSGVIPTGLLNYDANDRVSTDPYDAAGNLLNAGSGSNVYDFENRLTQSGGVSVVYDGDGNRVSEAIAGVTTQFLVADQNPTGYAQVVEELQSGAVTRAYSYGLELISQTQVISGSPSTSFYGFDGHGSVRYLTSSTGAVTDTYDYDSFGNIVSQTGSTPNNYLFAGEQFDPALGLYYNRARYYDQRQGRFWTMDTFEGDIFSPISLHKYLYVNADPVNNLDRSGHESLEEEAVAEGISEELDAVEGRIEQQLGQKIKRIAVCDIGNAVLDQCIQEGVYIFLSDVGGNIIPYVGQTADIAERIATHVRDGKIFGRLFSFIEVEGGLEARRIMEQKVINILTGGGLPPGVRNLPDSERLIANLRNEIRLDKFAKLCE